MSQWKCHRVSGAFYVQRLSTLGVWFSADIHGEIHYCHRCAITIRRIKFLHSQVFTCRKESSRVIQLDFLPLKWWVNHLSQISTLNTVDSYLSSDRFESLIQTAGRKRIALEGIVQWHNLRRKIHFRFHVNSLRHCNTRRKKILRLLKSQLNNSLREKILPGWVVWHVLQYFLQQSCGTVVEFVGHQQTKMHRQLLRENCNHQV